MTSGPPDISGTGWFDQPSSTPPGQPPHLLGTEQLQKAIDRFDAAVDKLAKLYASASTSLHGTGGGTYGAGRNNAGGSSFGGVSGSGRGFLGGKYNVGHLGREAAGILGLDIPLRGPVGAAYGGWGGMYSSTYGGFNGPALAGGATFGGVPGHYAGGAPSAAPATFNGQPMGSGGNSGGGFTGGSRYAGGGPSVPGGGGFLSANGTPTGAGYMASGALSLMAAFSSYGKASMPTQFAMSTFQQQGNLLAPSYAQGSNQYGDRMRTAAFGSNNANPNNFAMNASDAAQGYGFLQRMAGSGIAASTSTGRFGLGAAASFAGANPNMSYADAASMGQAMAMPSMSLRMMQSGYRTTPMKLGGGGANSFGSVVGSMMQRWYPGSKQGWVKPQNLAASLIPGQVGNQNLASLGYSPDQVQALSATMEAYNQVGSRTGMSASKIQSVFQGAQTGNKADLALLAKNHVTQSDLSKLKTYQAQGTMNQSDTYNSFTSGLNGTLGALTRFKQILNDIVNLPGVNQLVGGGGGAMGTLGQVSGDFKSIGEGAFGLGAMGWGASKMFGSRGAAGAVGSAETAGATMGTSFMSVVGPAILVAGAGFAIKSGLDKLFPAPKVTPRNPKDPRSRQAAATQQLMTQPGSPGAVAADLEKPVAHFLKGLLDFSPSRYGFSEGGRVGTGFKPGIDDHPAMLSEGETVLNPYASMALGYGNIDRLNKKYPAGKTRMINGILHAADGAAILSDARKYNGHQYVYGGPSNPQGGFDCSSFASYVLGHDEGLALPGGTWASTTSSGQIHGDVASQFINLPGAHKVSHNAADIQQGDVLVWSTHVGFGVGPGTMFSAYDTAQGVLQTPKDMANANGPGGEQLTIMRYGKGGGTSNSQPGKSGSPASGSTSTASGGGSFGGGGGSANSVNESVNVAAALGGGGGGGMSPGGSRVTTGTAAVTTPAKGGSKPGSPGNVPNNAKEKQVIDAILKGLGGPSSAANESSLANWFKREEPTFPPPCQYNPMATTENEPGATTFNSAGVKNYLSWNQGIDATVKTLDNGRYPAIVAALQKGIGLSGGTGAVASELLTWSGGGYSSVGSGGDIKRAGAYIVGERGREVVNLPAGAHVMSAKRTQEASSAGVAQVPWVASSAAAGASGLGGINVTLEFAPGSITISQGSGEANSRTASSNSAREIFSKVSEMMHSEELYTAIRNGLKEG